MVAYKNTCSTASMDNLCMKNGAVQTPVATFEGKFSVLELKNMDKMMVRLPGSAK